MCGKSKTTAACSLAFVRWRKAAAIRGKTKAPVGREEINTTGLGGRRLRHSARSSTGLTFIQLLTERKSEIWRHANEVSLKDSESLSNLESRPPPRQANFAAVGQSKYVFCESATGYSIQTYCLSLDRRFSVLLLRIIRSASGRRLATFWHQPLIYHHIKTS